MEFSTQQISPKRWGIYSGDRLLATVGCKATCETFMANFVSGRRDAPLNHQANALLYQVPQLRRRTELSEQVLTVKELEPAALKEREHQPPVSKKRARQTARRIHSKPERQDKVPSA